MGGSRAIQLKRARYTGLVPAAVNAVRLGYGAYQNYQRFKRSWNGAPKETPSAPSAITTQYDSKVMYRKRRGSRMFRRKARRYRKFVKKVVAANDTRLEKQRVLFIDNFQLASAANAQNTQIGKTVCYGGNTGVAGQRDLYLMETALGDSASSLTRTYFRSCHMEVAIKNIGADGCYVDVYYWKTNKDFKIATNLDTHFNGSFNDMPSNIGGLNQTNTTYGASPFLAKDFTTYFSFYKKTSTLLGAGAQMDFAVSKKKNFVSDFSLVNNNGALKGITFGVLIVVYGLPNSASDGTAGQATAATINVNVTRTYTFTSNRPALVDAGATVLTS